MGIATGNASRPTSSSISAASTSTPLLNAFPNAKLGRTIFLTTRPDLGDVSKGKLVTLDNFFELFNGVLNPKQLEGLRLLVTPFPQQQFNATDDRRSERPHRGVSCLDCHANGHANGATHLAGDVFDAGVPQPAFDAGDVGGIEARLFSELFLSQFARFAALAHVLPEGGEDGITFRHDL